MRKDTTSEWVTIDWWGYKCNRYKYRNVPVLDRIGSIADQHMTCVAGNMTQLDINTRRYRVQYM